MKTGLAEYRPGQRGEASPAWSLALRAHSYEPLEPIGVDPETDDLSLYPLLYWPMDPREKNLSPGALARIGDFMRQGGTIMFDTRDFSLGAVRGRGSPGEGRHCGG